MKELLETGVAIDLKYNEGSDALVGKIKDFSVAIKENDATKSYGCLMWLRKKSENSADELSAYLAEQVASKPHIIKHFKATERGAAIALVKYNDSFRNVNNIKRFFMDLSKELTQRSYVNCCYKCGKTSGLAIYSDNGSLVQCCSSCGTGEIVSVIEESELQPEEVKAPFVPQPPDESEIKPVNEAAVPAPQSSAEPELEPVKETAAPVSEPAEEAVPAAPQVEAADETGAEEETFPFAPVADEKSGNDESAPAVTDIVKDDEVSGLLADASDAADSDADDREKINTTDDGVDLSGFMIAETDAAAQNEKPRSEIFEAAQREFEEEKKALGQQDEQRDEAVDSLMFVAGQEPEKPAPSWSADAMPAENADEEKAEADIGGLMYDAAESAGTAESAETENVIGADDGADVKIDQLMADEHGTEDAGEEENATPEEPPIVEYVDEDEEVAALMSGEDAVTEVTAFTSGAGSDEDLVVASTDEEYVGEDENVAVTELYDDSDEGEDIDITESESDFNAPTDTSGDQINANDTPLEEDGSVPLVNPTSGFSENAPSGAYEPGAVRAYKYGSYENSTAKDEPVGFDGRPKGYVSGDPRMGDEMGSNSRNYAAQQAASPGSQKPVGAEHVSPAKPQKNKPISKSYSYSGGSNAVLGIIAAVLFGIIGAALWSGVGYGLDAVGLGYDTAQIITSACALLVTIFVFIGYRIGGDELDGKGVVISSVISVLLDIAGAGAFLVTSVLRRSEAEYGYNISVQYAMERAFKGVAEESGSAGEFTWLGIAGGAALITLIIAIVIAKKKK